MADLKPVPPNEAISLSRWSRLKRAAADEQAARAAPVEALLVSEQSSEYVVANAKIDVATSADYAELPPISAISLAEDFTPFMQAKVPQALKQQALKALFKEPHFNVMDGLDIYIDDYTVFEPISPEVMATLSSWKAIMNPPQQVVTSGGYAVDVESDEGKAVLAARAELASLNQAELLDDDPLHPSALQHDETEPASLHDAVVADETDRALAPPAPPVPLAPLASDAVGTNAKPVSEPTRVMTPIQHPRHNKRVGDFTYVDTLDIPPLSVEKAE